MSEDKIEIYWLTPRTPPKGWRKTMGVFGWEGEELYVSCHALGLTNHAALICVSYDGTPFCRAEGVVLVPELWARREKPELAKFFDNLREQAVNIRKTTACK